METFQLTFSLTNGDWIFNNNKRRCISAKTLYSCCARHFDLRYKPTLRDDTKTKTIQVVVAVEELSHLGVPQSRNQTIETRL